MTVPLSKHVTFPSVHVSEGDDFVSTTVLMPSLPTLFTFVPPLDQRPVTEPLALIMMSCGLLLASFSMLATSSFQLAILGSMLQFSSDRVLKYGLNSSGTSPPSPPPTPLSFVYLRSTSIGSIVWTGLLVLISHCSLA